MFVDELTINAKAGDGGDGVVRWRRLKFQPKAGPAGGNGGKGGDVYVRAVRDLNLLSKYTGEKRFAAEDGEPGRKLSQYGKGGEDCYIQVPVGSIVKDIERDRVYELFHEGDTALILKGGTGGLGNEYFKSSVNRTPQESTKGKKGETGTFHIELTLVVDVGLIGMPNAGKSTLLNQMTGAHSKVGDYAFTTTEPHLGALYGYTLADIPGLIEGASTGKGLGHTFLRHVTRTKMLLHLISLEHDDIAGAYYTISNELSNYDKSLAEREQWIVFTKKDLVEQAKIDDALKNIDETGKRVFVISEKDEESMKHLTDELIKRLRTGA